MKKNTMLSATIILTFGSLLAKGFSAIYRIILTRILGGEGIGLYQIVYPLYTVMVVFVTSGLTLAVSKVISKNPDKEKAILKKVLSVFSLISIGLTIAFLLIGKGVMYAQSHNELFVCYMILAPTLILISVSSILKGYFQGKHNFVPSAVESIAEQFVKMTVGLVLAVWFLRVSLTMAIVGAMVGVLASEIVSVFVLLLFFKKANQTSQNNISTKEIFADILPITATNLILPLAGFVDSLLVVKFLSFNFSHDVSVFLYGLESGAVTSILGLPTLFSFALANAVLPSLCEKTHPINKNLKFNLAIKLVIAITVPCALAFLFIPNKLITLLYGTRLCGNGIDGCVIASRLLALSSFGVVPLALNQVVSVSLQATNKRIVTIRNMFLAVVIKFVLEIAFLACKFMNIYVLAFANVFCYLAVFSLNFLECKEELKFNLSFEFFGKILLACFAMMLVLIFTLKAGSGIVNTILAIMLAGITYLCVVVLTKTVTKKDKAILKYRT